MESCALRHEGRDRPYLLYIPATAGPGAALVVQLHGRGTGAERFDEFTGFRPLADKIGFVLALPEAVGEIWNDGRDAQRRQPDDVSYLTAVLDDILARYPFDERRVYFVGMSNGAAMAGRFAVERSDRLTAFAQVAGTAAVWLAEGPKPALPVPILQIHGAADRFAPYAGGNRHGFWARSLIRRSVGPSVGVDAWAQFWIEANRADPSPRTSELPPDTTVRSWRDADGREAVVFYRVEDGGHTWPGSTFPVPRWLLGRTTHTFDATRTIWDFFADSVSQSATSRNISSST